MLAFALTVLVAVGAVAILADLSAERHFEEYVSIGRHSRMVALLPALEKHYATKGNWVGVETILSRSSPGRAGQGQGKSYQAGGGMPLVLADEKGYVVFDTSGRTQDERLSKTSLQGSQPIRVRGHTVGYLQAQSGPQEQAFSERLTRSLIGAGILASLVAILLGLLLTRAVVKPLRVVRDAAQRIGTGDLSYRAPVTSNDEIGDLARQFNEMAAALERDEQLRRKMMTDIAHELRTPLAIMRAQVEAVQDGVFELSQENIAPIHDQALLLGRLVDDLRDLALAEAGRLSLEFTDIRLDKLINRLVGAFQSQAQEKGLALLGQVPATLPLIRADAQRLEQVLGNLLSNALHHTPRSGRIIVRAWSDPEGVSFAVEDNGPGIAEEDLPHVFDRFYRADKARNRAEGHIGLGLSIAKQLVEAHGGSISAQSAPAPERGEPRGATFTVRLPHTQA